MSVCDWPCLLLFSNAVRKCCFTSDDAIAPTNTCDKISFYYLILSRSDGTCANGRAGNGEKSGPMSKHDRAFSNLNGVIALKYVSGKSVLSTSSNNRESAF